MTTAPKDSTSSQLLYVYLPGLFLQLEAKEMGRGNSKKEGVQRTLGAAIALAAFLS